MEHSVFEQELLAWSQRNGYITRERRWRDELRDEKDLRYQTGEKPDIISLIAGKGDVQKAKTFDIDGLTDDFEREVWTPTGIVAYACEFREDNLAISSAATYQAFLARGGIPCEIVHFYHGPQITQWKNEHLPRNDRKKYAVALARLTLFEQEHLSKNNLQILYDLNLLGYRVDPASRIMYEMRSFELEANKTKYLGLPLYAHQELSKELSLPPTAASYRKLLDCWAAAIDTTFESTLE